MRTGCRSCLLPPFSPGIYIPPTPSFPLFSFQSDGPSHSISVNTFPCTLLGMSGGHPCPSRILFPRLAQPFSYTSFSIHCSGNGRSRAPWTPTTCFSHQALSVFTFFNSSFQGADSGIFNIFNIQYFQGGIFNRVESLDFGPFLPSES